jgi:hypothetical protein
MSFAAVQRHVAVLEKAGLDTKRRSPSQPLRRPPRQLGATGDHHQPPPMARPNTGLHGPPTRPGTHTPPQPVRFRGSVRATSPIQPVNAVTKGRSTNADGGDRPPRRHRPQRVELLGSSTVIRAGRSVVVSGHGGKDSASRQMVANPQRCFTVARFGSDGARIHAGPFRAARSSAGCAPCRW